MSKFGGTIYLNNGRYWWHVRLPGEKGQEYLPLKPIGARFATKDKAIAELIAAELWTKAMQNHPQHYDGRLATLVQLYNEHNKAYYLPPSTEANNIEQAIMPLAKFYPVLMAEDFGPLHLKKFREFLVAGTEYDWSRKTINRRIHMVKRMFKWAAGDQLVSTHAYTSLTTIEGLRRGRTTARESKKVKPADIENIKAVITIVTPVLADMIQVQLLTSMRPGEICRMRPCDIDRSKDIWIYEPKAANENEYDHKTEYLGYSKIVPIGPKAQSILAKYMFRQPFDYCFKPEESEHQARKIKELARKTPLKYGNHPGTNNKGIRKFNDRYNTCSYYRAVTRACDKLKIERWYPHQLRHNQATAIRKEFGLDAARAVLGHRSVTITNEYAELDKDKAVSVAQAIG